MGDQVFAQHLDDGNAARSSRFELERDALFFCQQRQGPAMFGQQRLVGGHHMLAIGQRGFDQLASHAFIATDQLHHAIGIASCERQRIIAPARQVEPARLLPVARRNGGEQQRPSGALAQFILPCGQRLHDPAPDGAEAGDGDPEWRCHFASARSTGAMLVPMARNFFTLRAAWRMRCSFSTSATRT